MTGSNSLRKVRDVAEVLHEVVDADLVGRIDAPDLALPIDEKQLLVDLAAAQRSDDGGRCTLDLEPLSPEKCPEIGARGVLLHRDAPDLARVFVGGGRDGDHAKRRPEVSGA